MLIVNTCSTRQSFGTKSAPNKSQLVPLPQTTFTARCELGTRLIDVVRANPGANESRNYNAVVNSPRPAASAHIRHCSIRQDVASIGLAMVERIGETE
jgi:hypothetical protein